ncbi:hypothetical protein GWR56_07985 [Mucilaginibacter sp. 14171R-50]|uniref:BatA domain-containing protein n=1 Tax=Mucilaginibacter sp. 14171R-50 TaxID=2703789 RepID=UPI00138C503C|nr:BatA domain-containing protein [Mucilaginibacter sp. 14171R-50]QHS55480.1 hypothetical protein GWR56_07985 [Mucilaginibacter sp. 14171R-50]
MQFLSPIWFFALAAISIPVIIHLWNVRPGKTLKVGSISLITEASKSTRRSFRLLDILLLVLRCLLLGLLALLLASPFWQKHASAKIEKGWLLIPRENFKETYKKFKPAIDSLTKAGYGFHYFNNGFAGADLNNILADTALKDTAAKSNYWGLIKALDRRLSGATPVYIFTPNGIGHFKGDRPQVDLNLHWQTYTVADSLSRWIASAWLTNSGTIRVTVGNSSPAGTIYAGQVLQSGGNRDIAVTMQNGQPFVSLKEKSQMQVAVDTAMQRMAIYTDKHTVDANYLKAALLAAINFSGQKAVVNQYSSAAKIPAGQNWVFWLSEQALSGGAKSGENIFRYQAGKPADVNSWIDPGHITLAKRLEPLSQTETIWKDGFGKPVLGFDGRTYNFYSRFNPLWNDVVWSDEFPAMILKLISNKTVSQPAAYDKRIVDNAQLQPIIKKENKVITSPKATAQTSLSRYFWLLLVGLFIAERVVSHAKKQTNNG